MAELRMYALISMEALKACNGNRGKMLAQAGHAFLHSYWDCEDRFPDRAKRYRNEQAAMKVALRVETGAQLALWHAEIKDTLPCTFVIDHARTVFDSPTITALGIGPVYPDECPDWLKDLRPLM